VRGFAVAVNAVLGEIRIPLLISLSGRLSGAFYPGSHHIEGMDVYDDWNQRLPHP